MIPARRGGTRQAKATTLARATQRSGLTSQIKIPPQRLTTMSWRVSDPLQSCRIILLDYALTYPSQNLVDPPFFQKESDSSNEDKPYGYQSNAPAPRLATGQSSSADDYRSVIDDLTVEIQKLKEELKRFKQTGPDMLKKDQLFEIKYHGLPKRKRRELETTLRDFAASIGGASDPSSSQRKKSSRHTSRNHLYADSGSVSKHASSSSGSNARPADSAYASMSSGANSIGTALTTHPSASSRLKSDQKVENYLRDIPEGLYPRHTVLTDKERKRLVVRRLEQLFTGKIGGRHGRRVKKNQRPAAAAANNPSVQTPHQDALPQTKPTNQHTAPSTELAREAKILCRDQSGRAEKKSRSRDNGSASNSNGDQTESGGNGGNSSGSGPSTSPPTQAPAPEQRPTSLSDLDPDRVQVPSENMEYIRHLGLVPPELLADTTRPAPDVHPDADGWVYLNLLCNLAQLHIVNVTPSFVRAAVSEISTKCQLSPDGRKIRWRGGSEGTEFSSDSSCDDARKSSESEDTEMSGQRKRQRTSNSTGDEVQSGGSSKSRSKFGPQVSTASEGFHYKPLFVHDGSPNGQTSPHETLSSFGPIEDSNADDSRWGLSGSGSTNRRKRRHDGAIIYYSGAPFCTDLSGDPAGDTSPATYMMSSGQGTSEPANKLVLPGLHRSPSGSSLGRRPLSEMMQCSGSGLKMDLDGGDSTPELTTDDDDETSDADIMFPWSNAQQYIEVHALEPSGLGGVMPEDHFMVVVTTKRSRDAALSKSFGLDLRRKSEAATETIINRLASMSTSSPLPLTQPSRQGSPAVEIEYVSGRIKRLGPVPLPPPAIFVPPFSSDCSSDGDDEFGSEDDGDDLELLEELMSRQVNPHQSDGYPDGVDLSSGDEDGEDPEDEPDTHNMYNDKMDLDRKRDVLRPRADAMRRSISSAEAAPGSVRRPSKSESADVMLPNGGSSAATAGGVGSDYSSSNEES